MITGDCAQVLQSSLMQQIFRVESGGNPFAIGVVGNQLVRQPRTLPEAVATVAELQKLGFNFSIGKGQVNRVHFARLGWDRDISRGFHECTNVMAAAEIFNTCHSRAVKAGYSSIAFKDERLVSVNVRPSNVSSVSDGTYSATHAALSCYYSGDFRRGAQLGYVSKVLGVTADGGPAREAVAPRSGASMMID